MSEVTVQQAIEIALQHQHAGQLQEAEQIYRQILQVIPDQADALHLLGMIAYQSKALYEAEGLVRRAIGVVPTEAAFQITLGGILQSAGRIDEAISTYRDALKLRPDLAEAHTHLGVAFCIAKRHDEAVPAFNESLRLDPNNAYTQGNLGIALCSLNRFDESIAMLRAALAQLPAMADFHSALATALNRAGKYDEAIDSCRTALELSPNRGEAFHTQSTALTAQGKYEEAAAPARRAVELLPDLADTHSILADILRQLGKPDEAIAVLRNGLEKHPNAAELHSNLGTLLVEQALHDEGLAELRRATALAPTRADIHSNLLHAVLFHPTLDQTAILTAHRDFDRRHAQHLAPSNAAHANDADPDRALRIGYISSEFRVHPIGLNLVPLFENHDKAVTEIFCYSDVRSEDAVSEHLRKHAEHWQSIRNLTDEQVARKIREDRIDILIDLHQHAAGNHALVYARKPAPIQISFGCGGATTGLSAMGHRLTDPHLEPANAPPFPAAERPIHVAETLCCYLPRGESVPLIAPPALSKGGAGHVTFGGFNPPMMINDQTLALWAQVLRSLPNSTLTLLAPEGGYRQRTANFLQHNQIAANRISFVTPQRGLAHFEAFQQIDISLDTFPFNGHTVALDSLFMGVPVISLTGQPGPTPLSRTVCSHLANVGLQDLAANTATDFVRIATALASDLPRLSYLRANLRNRMRLSPLMNGQRFARSIEAAYRTAWRTWCERRG